MSKQLKLRKTLSKIRTSADTMLDMLMEEGNPPTHSAFEYIKWQMDELAQTLVANGQPSEVYVAAATHLEEMEFDPAVQYEQHLQSSVFQAATDVIADLFDDDWYHAYKQSAFGAVVEEYVVIRILQAALKYELETFEGDMLDTDIVEALVMKGITHDPTS